MSSIVESSAAGDRHALKDGGTWWDRIAKQKVDLILAPPGGKGTIACVRTVVGSKLGRWAYYSKSNFLIVPMERMPVALTPFLCAAVSPDSRRPFKLGQAVVFPYVGEPCVSKIQWLLSPTFDPPACAAVAAEALTRQGRTPKGAAAQRGMQRPSKRHG